jgi:hypothetical protein
MFGAMARQIEERRREELGEKEMRRAVTDELSSSPSAKPGLLWTA